MNARRRLFPIAGSCRLPVRIERSLRPNKATFKRGVALGDEGSSFAARHKAQILRIVDRQMRKGVVDLWRGQEHPPRPELTRFERISKLNYYPLGTIFGLGWGTIASIQPGQTWRIPSDFADGERRIRTLGPPSEPSLRLMLLRSRTDGGVNGIFRNCSESRPRRVRIRPLHRFRDPVETGDVVGLTEE